MGIPSNGEKPMGYVTDERFRSSKFVRTTVEKSTLSTAPLKLLACTLILLGSSGCATAWARGIVHDETGKEVSDQQKVFEEPCIPVVISAASQLGVR
jgi:hypothetical protein